MTLLVLATWAADLKMDVESELNIVTVFGQVIVAKDAVEACTVKEGLHVVPVAGHFESGSRCSSPWEPRGTPLAAPSWTDRSRSSRPPSHSRRYRRTLTPW